MKLNQSLMLVWFIFAGFGAILSLSFYQDSKLINNTPDFWMISLIIPITLYFFFIKFKKIINSLARSFGLGLFFGYGFFIGGLHWLIKAPLEVMGLSLLMSLFLFWLLMTIFALSITPFFIALFIAMNRKKNPLDKNKMGSKQNPIQRLKKIGLSQTWLFCFILPSIWVLSEWFRSELLFMPLLKIAHPQIDNFLASLASLFGVYSISFIIWGITGLVFLIFQTHPKKMRNYLWALVILITTLFFYSQFHQKKFENLEIKNNQKFVIVQGNINQNHKFDGLGLDNEIKRYFYLSEPFEDSIIIWPETAIATFWKNAKQLVEDKLQIVKENNSTILSGVVLEEIDLINPNNLGDENQSNYYTALANLDDVSQNYRKTKLVLFGEYIPFLSLLKPLLQAIETPYSSYSAADFNQNSIKIQTVKLASGICFEGAYGRLYSRYQDSNVLINISNDAWFNHSSALPILFNAIRFRSIEMGKYLVRSANTGISAFIDPTGKIVSFLPSYQAGAISMKVPLMNQKTLYSQISDWPILLLSIFFMGLFLVALRTKNK